MTAPPRFAKALLRAMSAPDSRDFLVDDLDEEFRLHSRTNPAEARWWYRRQVALSIAPQLWHRLFHHATTPQPAPPMSFSLAEDVRNAIRVARRSPWITATVVVTMMMGIGVATSALSILNGLVLKPLPFPESSQVVRLGVTFPEGKSIDFTVYPDLLDYKKSIAAYSDIAAFSTGSASFIADGSARIITTNAIAEPYARVFSWRPVFGRLLDASDFRPHGTPSVVLSHDFWTKYTRADSSIVGRTITLTGRPVLVAGVLAADSYHYPAGKADVYLPLYVPETDGLMGRMCHCIAAVAKLRRGESVDAVSTATALVHKRIVHDFAAVKQPTTPTVVALKDAVIGSASSVLWLVTAAVGAVLLIACVNIGNLLLGRSHARAREFAVRTALGGSRTRLIRQLVTESLVVAAMGAVPGILLAPAVTRMFAALYPAGLPRAAEMHIDPFVALGAVAITLIAAITGALPTIRRAMAADVSRALRDAGRMGTSRGQRRAAHSVILAQVAVSVALVFAAATLTKTFHRISHADTGFRADHLLTFRISAPAANYPSAQSIDDFYARLQSVIQAQRGVSSVGTTSFLPFGDGQFINTYWDDLVGDRGASNPTAFIASIDSGYFPALGAQLVRGRGFANSDLANAPPVVIVNESVARTLFPGGDAIGKYITSGQQRNMQIVGVVKDMHTRSLWDLPEPQIFMPVMQRPQRTRTVVIRTNASAPSVRSGVENALRALDARIPVASVATMEELLSSAVAPQRFRATLVGALGFIALALATLGIYSVVAYSVHRQTREIGLRMALGELRSQIARRVMWTTLQVTAAGAVVGLILAVVEARWIGRFVIGGSVYDASLFAGAIGVLLAVTMFAAYLPARRASSVDPLVALRSE